MGPENHVSVPACCLTERQIQLVGGVLEALSASHGYEVSDDPESNSSPAELAQRAVTALRELNDSQGRQVIVQGVVFERSTDPDL